MKDLQEYKLSIIRKYLTEEYKHRDTPAFIRYNHTKTKEDLQRLLDEYLEDSAFLSVTILDKVLGKIEGIQGSLEDEESIGQCHFYYDVIHDLREAKYDLIVASDWEHEVLNPLLETLNININQ
tara:strand:+ start:105 stop:476 length:372 start_codon:yes stop_codon:yes gene_type:complete